MAELAAPAEESAPAEEPAGSVPEVAWAGSVQVQEAAWALALARAREALSGKSCLRCTWYSN